MRIKTKDLALIAVMIALVTVVTVFTKIPLMYSKGYFNIGDALVMSFSTLIPVPLGTVVGGIGSALADGVTGYYHYLPGTLVIKAVEAAVTAILYKKLPKPLNNYLPFLIGATLMVLLYGVYDYLLTGSINSIWISVSLNAPQGIACAIIAIILTPILQRVKRYIN